MIMMIMPAAQISDSPLTQPPLVLTDFGCFDWLWLPHQFCTPCLHCEIQWRSYVLLPALDYKQQTTFISQGHGQMKLPDIAEKGMKVMEWVKTNSSKMIHWEDKKYSIRVCSAGYLAYWLLLTRQETVAMGHLVNILPSIISLTIPSSFSKQLAQTIVCW